MRIYKMLRDATRCSEIWWVKMLRLAFHDFNYIYMSTLRFLLDSDLWEQLTSSAWQVDAKAVFGPGYDPLCKWSRILSCQLPHSNIMKSWVLRPVPQRRVCCCFFEIVFGLCHGRTWNGSATTSTNLSIELNLSPAAPELTWFPNRKEGSWS